MPLKVFDLLGRCTFPSLLSAARTSEGVHMDCIHAHNELMTTWLSGHRLALWLDFRMWYWLAKTLSNYAPPGWELSEMNMIRLLYLQSLSTAQ